MNENQLICKTLRKEFSKVGWALLAYYGIMNLAILLSSLVMGVIAGIQMALTPGMTEEGYNRLLENVIQDATWGYAVAVVVGAVLLLIWRYRSIAEILPWNLPSTDWGHTGNRNIHL